MVKIPYVDTIKKAAKDENILDSIKNLSKKRPIYFAMEVIVVFAAIFAISSIFTILPKGMEAGGRIMRKGDLFTWLGMELRLLTRERKRRNMIPMNETGMMVMNAGMGTAAALGIQNADIIHTINNKHIKSRQSFIHIVENTSFVDGILLQVSRGGTHFYLSIPVQYLYGPLYGPYAGQGQYAMPMQEQLRQSTW